MGNDQLVRVVDPARSGRLHGPLGPALSCALGGRDRSRGKDSVRRPVLCRLSQSGRQGRKPRAGVPRQGRSESASQGLGEGRPSPDCEADASVGSDTAYRTDLRQVRIDDRGIARSGGRSSPDPGRTDTFRRLNRTEYQNAIRDLLALDIDASTLLPAGRVQPRVRQRDGGRPLADAAGSLYHRGAEDQPAGRRQSRPLARAATRSASGRTSRRRSTSRGCRSGRAAGR